MRSQTVLFSAALLVVFGPAFTSISQAQSPRDLVRASLVANISAVKAGESFEVGVLLHMKSGWHTYWSNPGDAGLPTRVRWTLPPGYTASPLRFPVPEHIDQRGGLVIYGYNDQVLLMSTITPAQASLADARPATVEVSAKVSWLCCSEECVPGKAELQLHLPIAESSKPDNVELFERWHRRLPVPAASAPAPLVLSDPSPHTTIHTSRSAIHPADIIPGAVDGLIVKTSAPTADASGTQIEVTAQLLKGQEVSAKSVPILITWSDPAGGGRVGEEIDVPIVAANVRGDGVQ
jgi:DsbC/DsbD-like thiol-disulfide interchange protein